MGYGLLMTLRGMPELYAGDEIGMLGGEDPDNRRDFPGGFPGDKASAFTAAGRSGAQSAMHDWVAALGRLRASSTALQGGRQQTVLAGETSFAYVRSTSVKGGACSVSGSMLVVLNRDKATHTVTIPVSHNTLEGCKSMVPSLSGATSTPAITIGAKTKVTLPAFGFEVYALQ